MQSHEGKNTEVVPKLLPAQPLTRCSPAGTVYQRPAVVERQIENALMLTPPEVIERAREQGYQSPGYLQEECLVYLIRVYHSMDNVNIVNALTEALLRRCSRSIITQLRSLDMQELDDAYRDVLQELFGQILDLESNRGDFLQVHFWVVLKRIGISRFRRYVTSQEEVQRTVPLSSLAGYEPDDDDDDRRGIVPFEDVVNDPISLERHVLAQEGLRLLPERHRTAFILRHGYGWPIEHRDPAVLSISRYFGVTSRAIRLWLSQAEETLAHWRGETNGTAQ